ncbi:mitotic spindle checkpoint protein Bub3 [Blastocladiella emersonii ATCC 22665]|nr:mitotic spindle checkpoint protein Bub3 [Blastocladiella emersonii ATCC 22665]
MSSTLTDLANPPAGAISRVAFSPSTTGTSPPLLLAASWDATVRVYDPAANRCLSTADLGSPVTNAVWDAEGKEVYATGLVYTGGWDSTLRCWDPRSHRAAQTHVLPGKVFALDATKRGAPTPLLVAATHTGRVLVYDRRRLGGGAAVQDRESSLRYQTRDLVCTPDGEGYAMSSTEGRIAVEFFDPSPASQSRRFAFKCHRQTRGGTEYVYPVNALAFHPVHTMTFASAGADGVVGIWDGTAKKRLRALARQPTSTSSVAFSPAGDVLVAAVSYTYEEGERAHPPPPPDAIVIRRIADVEVQSKAGAKG